jgi:hypothetical protein
MQWRRSFEKVRLNFQRHGPLNALHDVALKVVNSIVRVKILRCMWIERVDPAFLTCPEPYTSMFLTEEMLRAFAKDGESDMPESLVAEALSKGDECYGILDGRTLAAYGWYSTKPSRVDPPDLILRFGREYVYMYRGFTHPGYRGQRLHAIGMTLALRSYRAKGFKGLISYVESNNFDSLKSTARMGYVVFGSVYAMTVFGRTFRHASRGCDRFGVSVERASA